jgi:4-amino-4-deoxy-L-arabinose transferase-like glycosyltransferase
VTRSAWLDPGNIRSAILLALIAAAGNTIWVFLDHSTPSFDQSNYMNVAIVFRDALQHGGPVDLYKAIRDTDPSRGPLFTIGILPFLLLFGDGARSGVLLNIVLAPILYLSAGQIAWLIFRNGAARLLAILFVATMPLIVGLQHEILQDFLLLTLTTVSVLLLLMSDGFSRRGFCVALGVAMGLGTLTKVTFPLFMLGPLVVVLVEVAYAHFSSRRAGKRGPDLRAAAINLGLTALVYLAIIAPWYVTNLQPTLDYINSTTSGPLAEGAGPEHPLTFHAIASFTSGMLNEHVSWVLVLVFLAALAFDLPGLARLLRAEGRVEPLLRLAFVATWALVPYLIVATAHNQDVRLMAPAMPAMAVIAAGAVAAVPLREARVVIAGLATVALVYQTAIHVVRIDLPLIPNEASVRIGQYTAVVPLDDRPIGYERMPEADIGTPIMEYIERTAAAEPGRPPERSVCVLESEVILNTNTIYFLINSRGDPFNVVAEMVGPTGRAGLAANLHECDFALYMKQASAAANPSNRVAIVNNDFAARYMTPALFRIFRGPQRVFPATPDYLTDRAPTVRVLTLNPAR